jgi:hypothetical protein
MQTGIEILSDERVEQVLGGVSNDTAYASALGGALLFFGAACVVVASGGTALIGIGLLTGASMVCSGAATYYGVK